MKRNLLLWAVFAGMMALTACTQEKVVYVEENEVAALKPGEGVIKINLSNNVSRAARPITSNEATNNVNRIAFVFVASNGNQYFPTIAATNEEQESYGYTSQNNVLALDENSLDGEITVHFEDMTPGSYKIIAYGYNAGAGNYDFPYEIESADGYNGFITFKAKAEGSMTPVEEVFAGMASSIENEGSYLNVNEYGNFVASDIQITLERQVAGLLAYMSKVPVKVSSGGEDKTITKITISTSFSASGLCVPASGSKAEYNGLGTCLSSGDYVDLLTFDLAGATAGSDGYYKFNGETGKKYLLANENEGQASELSNLTCQDNTLFGSCFVIPFNQHYSNWTGMGIGTLYINYYDNSGLVLSKALADNGNYEYDIKCNHFYSIGVKDPGYDGSGNPDPDTDDEPLPIDEESGSDNLKVNIDNEWDGFHGLTNKTK